ncbi:regulator of nonsense transcripts 3 [Mytilus galloprovincialis]|uniref:Regulator of nonsense transcripts 3 n=1 Tax=Mytilus galloprovincialis TaxID=29158 RepID=A0A8B6BIS9_MYTGA|nr:regulator of nonsense transcripts 3 [Mytilus galloprovincialis]
MLKFQLLGYYSDNELFALKKNVCEDTKLRGKVGSLSLQFNLTKDSLQNNIKTVRHDLKEIRRSTGRSQDGIPVIRSASHVSSISESFPTPSVPQIILDQIIHSDYGRNLNFSSSVTENKKRSSKKVRAITGTVRSYNELESVLRAARRRKIKSQGGITKQLLSIDQLPIDVNQVDCSSGLTSSFIEDDVFDDSNKIVSGSSPVLQCVEHLENAETHTHNQNHKLSTRSNKEQEQGSKECSNETEEKPKETANNLSVFHSPWKVHNRSGKTIDPLEIPHIKDCYRPMCRPNCSTCLSRKKKTPCFLVPGINISHDHFNIVENVEDSNEGRTKRKTSKNRNKIYENAETVESTIDNGDIVAQCTKTENYLPDLNISNEKESRDIASFVAECLEIRKNTTRKVISKARITELSRPKDGGRKDVRFTKTFIKKELEKMKKSDPISQLTSEERRRLHRVQGQIALFLAVLNQRRACQVKPMNEVLDSFPIREDFHHQHEPVALPTIEMPGNRRTRRKVLIRRLPPSLTPETLLEQLSPLPSHEFYFVRADMSLGQNAFTRAYINFQSYEDVYNFRDQFDGYVFVDGKGNEYSAIVELAPYQKVPRRKPKKVDVKMGSIEQDPDYVKFLEYLQNEEAEETQTIEAYLEELELKEKDMKAKKSMKVSTPLIDYIRKKREEKKLIIQKQRDERKKKELERRKIREDDRRRRREKEQERFTREKERDRERYKDKERQREKDRERESERKEKSQDEQPKVLKKPEKDDDKKLDKDSTKEKVKDGTKDVKPKEDKFSESSKKERENLRFSKENREKERREKEKREKSNKIAAALLDQKPKSSKEEKSEDKSKLDEKKGTESSKGKEPKQEDKGRSGKWDDAPERKDSRGSKDDKYDKYDRPRSSKDSRSSQGRPRSGRDWDRDREWDYRDRGYREERPRSYAGPSRDERRRQETSTEKRPSSSRKEFSSSSEKETSKGDTKSSEKSLDKKASDVKEKAVKKDSSKNDAEKEKKSDQLKEKDSSNGENKLKSSDSFDDDKKKKRKERPERAIYDPRKAAERRMVGTKPSDSGKNDKSSDDKSSE